MERLKSRMYFFVNRSLAPIQKGIQAGHAVEQYAFQYGETPEYLDYIRWDKTWIILDGGTSSTSGMGDMERIKESLSTYGIPFGHFKEPDINNALTAICFLCDERVWNKEVYPDFEEWTDRPITELDTVTVNLLFGDWLDFVGGQKIDMLRDLLKDKRLAQ